MTALAGATRVQIGPFRGLRMKKTAPRGIKDHNDRASWTNTGADGSFQAIKDEKGHAPCGYQDEK